MAIPYFATISKTGPYFATSGEKFFPNFANRGDKFFPTLATAKLGPFYNNLYFQFFVIRFVIVQKFAVLLLFYYYILLLS